MSKGNGVSDEDAARKIVAHLLKQPQLLDRRLPPIVRHSLRVGCGGMPSAQPVDRTLVIMFRYGHEVEHIAEHDFLLVLMDLCGRVVPLAYPDEDRPDFIILPDGRKIWVAKKAPASEDAKPREHAKPAPPA